MKFKLSKTIKLAVRSYINQSLSLVLLLIQVKFLTRFLPVSNFGAWSQVCTLVTLSNMVLCLNLGHGFIRFASAYSMEEKQICFGSVLSLQLTIHILAAGLMWPFRYLITRFISDSPSDSVYWAIVFMAVFSVIIINIQNYLLVTRREMQMVRQNLIRLASDVFFTTGGIWLRRDLQGAVWGCATSGLACSIFFSWINRIDYRRLSFSYEIIKTLLRFSLPLMSVSIAYWVISSSNRYLVNYFMGLEAVGRFSVANRLPMMLVIIFTLLSTIFLSNVSRLFDEKNFERVSYWFSLIIKFFLYLGVAGGAALIAGNRALTLILSNESYLFPSLPLVYLCIVIGSLSFGCFQILSRLYELEKQVYRSSVNWIIAMLLNVGLNIWLIPKLGLVGGAIATGASFLAAFLIGWFFRPKRIVVHLPSLRLLAYVFTALLGAWIYTVYCDGQVVTGIWPALFVSAGVGGLTLLFGLLLRIVTWQEFMELVKRS